jgi:hypothetical protein
VRAPKRAGTGASAGRPSVARAVPLEKAPKNLTKQGNQVLNNSSMSGGPPARRRDPWDSTR